MLGDVSLKYSLRYRHRDQFVIIEAEEILPFMEVVFQRCLSYVMPGAKRTVFPRA
jgi:hypothetical protein